jgi:hypothetical protein
MDEALARARGWQRSAVIEVNASNPDLRDVVPVDHERVGLTLAAHDGRSDRHRYTLWFDPAKPSADVTAAVEAIVIRLYDARDAGTLTGVTIAPWVDDAAAPLSTHASSAPRGGV